MIQPGDSASVLHEEDVDTIELQLSADEMRALTRAAIATHPDVASMLDPDDTAETLLLPTLVEQPAPEAAATEPSAPEPVQPTVQPPPIVVTQVTFPPPVRAAAAAPPPPTSRFRTAHIVLAIVAFVGGLLSSVAYVAMTGESRPPPPPTLAAEPPVIVDELPPLPPEDTQPPAPEPAPEPVLFRNPFDRSEVFEFPPGTTKAEARDAVAEILMQRARERSVTAPRQQSPQAPAR